MKKNTRRLIAALTLATAVTTIGITADSLAVPQDDTGWGAPAGDTGWGSLPANSDTSATTPAGTDVNNTVTPLMDTAWG
jgi:hypothetical protein